MNWQQYFYQRKQEHDKSDWQNANICRWIAESMGGIKKSRLSSYLLEYGEPRKKRDSKSTWLMLFGLADEQADQGATTTTD